MTPEEKSKERLRLLHIIQVVNPIGEPFNDALFLCATALAAAEPEARQRARQKIFDRLKAQSMLANAYMSSVVLRADEMGYGKLPFAEAAEAIGTEFGKLRDDYLDQLRRIML